ncbi:hypothetical protein [Peribacillus sp. SCS-155]|uniref:hypothetical protein n=1 Tax=Peribacillus sedimenti TaxID=3115297 RepID=UPI00390602B3
MLYNVMLFFHILGTAVMFIAVGITLTGMIAMLHARNTETLRNWAQVAVKMDGLLPFSVILILLPGLYLAISSWGWGAAWVNISLAVLIAMTIAGPIINLRRLKAILEAANNEKSSTPSTYVLEKVRDTVLWKSVVIMTLLAVALLFLMTMKLDYIGSLVTLAIGVITGIFAANILLKNTSKAASMKHRSTNSTQKA